MATSKITYADKVGINPRETHINQVWDDDMNEIKLKLNANADLQDALEVEVDINTLDIADNVADIATLNLPLNYIQIKSNTPSSNVITTPNVLQNIVLTTPVISFNNLVFDNVNKFTYTGISGTNLLFIGSANEVITDTIAPGIIVDVTMSLKYNGVVTLETPVSFTNKDEVASFGTNYLFVNVQQNDYFTLEIKATVAHTVLIKSLYIQFTQLK